MRGDQAFDRLEDLLGRAHHQLGIAVYDGLMSSGGPPELRALIRCWVACLRLPIVRQGMR